MLSEECLADGGPSSEALESMDVTSKKKKSFHPLRSLKRFFGHGVNSHGVNSHGGNSRRRSNNDDVAESSSVLLKARSTTDVIVSGETTEEAECAFKRVSKQISLSADSIFSTERTCDSNLPVSAISSEALLHSESCVSNSLLKRKDDDDEGLPQSPCNLATTAELFIENGLKEDQSERWPSFDSGHSLLSVDSNENEAEEDFFKEKWVTVSKSSTVNAGNETSATDSSLRDDLDLNLVQRHSSLSSSAAIHRLAVRPKGKRGLSTYQQKLNVTSLKLAVSGKSLPLVKEESGNSTRTPNTDSLDISESHEKFSGSVMDSAQSSENYDSTRSLSATKSSSSAKKVHSVYSLEKVEKVGTTRSNETEEVIKGSEKIERKSGENTASVKSAENLAETIVINKSTENVGLGETAVLQREMTSSRMESTSEESCKPATVCAESETSLSQVPAKQTVVPLSVVVVRQKPPRSVVPSAQEIQEMAARRQTLAFSGDSGSGAEKPVSKRSSMVIPDRPLNPVETENTELAQMFSKFQRRSSQKRQPEVEDSRPVEENNNSGRASETVSQIATDSKPVFAQTASKEQASLAKAVTGAKNSGKLVEVSSQARGGSPVGVNINKPEGRVTNSAKCAEKKVEKSAESNENSTSRGSEKRAEKNKERSVEKTAEKNKERSVEKTAEKNKERSIEKAMEKNTEFKVEAVDQKEASVILNKSENVKNIGSPLSASDEKTKGVKKAYSISYKTTKSAAEKSAQGTAAMLKTRSSSQSEPSDGGGAEVPTKTPLLQTSRRGSFTYSHKSDGRTKVPPAPSSSSEISSLMESVADDNGRTMDIQYKPPSITTPTTRPPSRPGTVLSNPGMVATGSRMVPSGSGTVPAVTETPVPSGCGTVPSSSGIASSRVAMTHDRVTTVPLGSRVVPRVIVAPGTVRPTGISGATPKESVIPVAPQVIPTTDRSSKGAKVLTNASEMSGHPASSSKASEGTPTNRDASQPTPKAAAPSIRPTGGQRIPAVKEGENLVEWVGVARQKKRAWKEGKIDVAEKVESCN